MECTITSTAQRIKKRRGFTLMETVVAGGLGSIVLAAIATFSIFSTRSFTAIGNYVTLDMQSRNALDAMSRDIRQSDGCSTNTSEFTPTSLTLLMTNPTNSEAYTISYNYSTNVGTLTRTYINTNSSPSTVNTVLLTNCTSFAFSYYQRNPTNGVWDAFPVDTSRPDECKVVQLDWNCQRTVLGRLVNSESIESAKVVIRKE